MMLLILASGFFSGSETALFYLSREEIRQLEGGKSGARLAARLLRNPDRLLTVVLFWNLVINLTYFATSLVTTKKLIEAGAPSIAGALTIGSLILMILGGEVGPKSVAVIFRRSIAVWASWPLTVAASLVDPVLPILRASTQGLTRAMYPDFKPEPYIEVDDLERAIESTELATELIQLEQRILGRVLHLSEMMVEELMRPRGTYHVVSPPLTHRHFRLWERTSPYLFVCGDDCENVTSVVPLYELSTLPEENLDSLIEPVAYVPWCTTVAETLSVLRSRRLHVAAVVNEYGETIGVVTEDDIIDTLLNPESSRARRLLNHDPIHKLPDGRVVAEGLTTLRYLAQWLETEFEPDEDGLLTIVGWMHDDLERFPEVGDTSIWGRHRFEVIRAGNPGDPIQVEIVAVDPVSAETLDSTEGT